MTRYEKMIERKWQDAINDSDFVHYVEGHNSLECDSGEFHLIPMSEKEELLRSKNYLTSKSKLDEMIAAIVETEVDKRNVEVDLTDKEITEIENELVERILKFMPNSSGVSIKKNCTLAGKKDGTSDDCNQGEIKNIKFKRITENKQLLNERSGGINYGCLMLYFDMPDWKEITGKIDKEDIYVDEPGYGLETEPHVTILYGFHANVKPNKVFELVESLVENPIEVKLIEKSVFYGDERDVVKFDVDCDFLSELNKKVKKFSHTSTHPKYHPHMTIAYVKPGKGDKYLEKLDKPIKIKSGKFVFSDKDKKKSILTIK